MPWQSFVCLCALGIAIGSQSLADDAVSVSAEGAPRDTAAKRPPADKPRQSDPPDEPDAKEKILRALEEESGLECAEMPLRDVAAFLSERHGIPIRFDEAALEERKLSTDQPVTRILQDVTLGSLLRLVLRELSLVYTVHDDALLITTNEFWLSTSLHLAADLVQFEDEDGRITEDVQPLIELITAAAAPRSWGKAGGAGDIRSFRGMLLVTQPWSVQHEVQAILAALRKLPRVGDAGAEFDPQPIIAAPQSEARTKAFLEIRDALTRPTSAEYVSTPLVDAVEDLRRMHGIPIQIDRAALDSEGVKLRVPVTLQVRDEELHSVLDRMLSPIDLTWNVTDEVLLISTPGFVDDTLTMVVYPVADLIAGESMTKDEIAVLGNDLIEVLVQSVTPNSWNVVGGPASMHVFPDRAALVCRQTGALHVHIMGALDELRKRTREHPDGLSLKQRSRRLVTEIYIVAASKEDDAGWLAAGNDIEEMITRLVEPESWNRDGVYIQALPGRIVVQHRRDVQPKIRRLLETVGRPATGKPPSGGGVFRVP